MTRVWSAWLLAAVVTAGVVASAAESLRIVPLVRENQVTVSVELTDAYADDVRAAISSGLRTTFTYDVELRMAVAGWVDPTIATAVVNASDQYDNLTRRHTLQRTVDGRIVDEMVTEDESVAKKFLTTLAGVPLVQTSKLDASRDYYVRISARARPRGGSFLGWTSAITGQAKFTFIP